MTDDQRGSREPTGVAPRASLEGGVSRGPAHGDVEDERPFAVLTARRNGLSAAENAARDAALASALRGLNLGHALVEGACVGQHGGKVKERGFLVVGDEYMEPAAFRRAMAALGARFEQESILLGSGEGEVVLVATRDTDAVGPKGVEKRLGRFAPARIEAFLSAWKGRPFILETLSEGYVARSRRAMGWMTGRAVQENRAQAARR